MILSSWIYICGGVECDIVSVDKKVSYMEITHTIWNGDERRRWLVLHLLAGISTSVSRLPIRIPTSIVLQHHVLTQATHRHM